MACKEGQSDAVELKVKYNKCTVIRYPSNWHCMLVVAQQF